jgi:hypothetical protein
LTDRTQIKLELPVNLALGRFLGNPFQSLKYLGNLCPDVGKLLQQLLAFGLAFLVVVAGEEGGNDQVACEADQVQGFVGDGQLLVPTSAC